jgi:hypothetical protein
MHDWRVAATGKDDRMTLWRSLLAWLAALSAESTGFSASVITQKSVANGDR